MWHDPKHEPEFSEYLELNLSDVVPSIAGPKRPQDRIALAQAKSTFREQIYHYVGNGSQFPRPALEWTVSKAHSPAGEPGRA